MCNPYGSAYRKHNNVNYSRLSWILLPLHDRPLSWQLILKWRTERKKQLHYFSFRHKSPTVGKHTYLRIYNSHCTHKMFTPWTEIDQASLFVQQDSWREHRFTTTVELIKPDSIFGRGRWTRRTIAQRFYIMVRYCIHEARGTLKIYILFRKILGSYLGWPIWLRFFLFRCPLKWNQ
jgi:hypothetical protein